MEYITSNILSILYRLFPRTYHTLTFGYNRLNSYHTMHFGMYTEGLCEACPQTILQLCLLVPELYGDWTWTDYLRIVGAFVSLCTAGAALVNCVNYYRINNSIKLPLSALIVLHVWAVPVTVSRLLSLALLLIVHPYWALAGVALHLMLHGVHWCRTVRVLRALGVVLPMCQKILPFCMSPFNIACSVTFRRVSHATHFLGNTAATVMWALGTALVCAHTARYTAIICFNAVMFTVRISGLANTSEALAR